MDNERPHHHTVVIQEHATNIYALIGLVFSLLGLFTCGAGSLIGLPFSVIGCFPDIAGTRKNGMAIAGCIIGGLQVIGWVMMPADLAPIYYRSLLHIVQ